MPRTCAFCCLIGLLGIIAWLTVVDDPALSQAGHNPESVASPASRFTIKSQGLSQVSLAQPTPLKPDLNSARLARAESQLGIHLLEFLSTRQTHRNVLVAPGSIATSLLMLASGANGRTRAEILKPLGLDDLPSDSLSRAASVFKGPPRGRDAKGRWSAHESLWASVRLSLRPEYVRQMSESLGARVTVVNFSDPAAAAAMDNWVQESSMGRIKAAFTERPSPSTLLALISVVDFQRLWAIPFDLNKTRSARFTLADGRSIDHPTMQLVAELPYVVTEGFRAVDLSYASSEVFCTLILPDPGLGVTDLLGRLRSTPISEWTRRMAPGLVALRMPRVSLKSEQELVGALSALGIRAAFSPDEADFGAMIEADSAGAFVQRFEHSATIDIHEMGTEASAKTSAAVGLEGASEFHRFTLDRPFVFLIRDRATGILLFAGVVADPR